MQSTLRDALPITEKMIQLETDRKDFTAGAVVPMVMVILGLMAGMLQDQVM